MSELQIHITRNGEQHGPYPEANAREMLAAGQLLPTDLAWHAGADGWKPLSEVLGAATQPPATPPPPPTPPEGGMPKRTMARTAPAEEKPAEEKPEDSEPDDPDKISVTRKGEPIGPYSREKAKEYFASGQLLPTDWGWHDGMDDWKPINEVLGVSVPGQATAAAGKSGKGKKVAMIAGIVVLVAGLGAAGYFFLYPMLKGDSEGDSEGDGIGGDGEVTKKLSAEEEKVVGFRDRIDGSEFEKEDNDGEGDYEFFANGEAAMNPSTEPILDAANKFLWSDEMQESMDGFRGAGYKRPKLKEKLDAIKAKMAAEPEPEPAVDQSVEIDASVEAGA